jgi:hypothetical protein
MVRIGTECRAPATLAGVGGWKALKRLPLWGRILVDDQSEALLAGNSPVSSQKTFLLHKRLSKEHVS